jgi:hypothetical protein
LCLVLVLAPPDTAEQERLDLFLFLVFVYDTEEAVEWV